VGSECGCLAGVELPLDPSVNRLGMVMLLRAQGARWMMR